MNQGMQNLLGWLDRPVAEVWAMGTANPARVLGLADRGGLAAGMRADLVLWEEGEVLTPAATWVGGKKVFG